MNRILQIAQKIQEEADERISILLSATDTIDSIIKNNIKHRVESNLKCVTYE